MNLPSPHIDVVHLDPVRAEVLLTFAAGALAEGEELRGRIVGPRCPGVSTIEVAYPLRTIPNRACALMGVVPEPSLWERDCPFLYDILLERWRDGVCTGRSTHSLGLSLQDRKGAP